MTRGWRVPIKSPIAVARACSNGPETEASAWQCLIRFSLDRYGHLFEDAGSQAASAVAAMVDGGRLS